MDRTSNKFLPSTPELDSQIAQAKSSSEIREVLDSWLAKNNIPSRGQHGVFSNVSDAEVREHQTQPSSLPAESVAPTGSRCYRVVYPFQNTRVELFGNTEAELDSQEAAIRSLYPKQ